MDALQARVEVAAKRQTLHAAGYMDAIQALVEIHKRQSLQAAGQFDALQALVEVAAQRQTPQAAE